MGDLLNSVTSGHQIFASFYEPGKQSSVRSPTDTLKAVQTGDISNLGIMAFIFLISLLGIVLILYRRKKKKAALSVFLIGCVLTAALAASDILSAASMESSGTIGFTGKDTYPMPLDPNDPGDFLEESKKHVIVGINGVYLMMAPDFDFGNNRISDQDQLYPAGKMTIKSRASGIERTVDNYVEICDERNYGGGWKLTATLKGQLKNEKGRELTGAEIRISDTIMFDEKREPNQVSAPDTVTLRPGVETLVMTAAKNTDAIRYYDIFKTTSLFVPGKSAKEEGNYTAELIWGLYDTP